MKAFQSILKKKTHNRPMYKEVLLHNKLDEDFQKILYPFTVIQTITCNYRYFIKDGFIVSNTLLASTVTGFATLAYLVSSSHYFFKEVSEPTFVWYASIFSVTKICDFILYSTRFLLITAIKVYKSQENVTLVLLIHKVHNIYRNENYGIAKLYYLSRSVLTIFVIWYTIECVSWYCMTETSSIDHVVLEVLEITFEIDMIYSICLMSLMRINMLKLAAHLKTLCLSYDQIDQRTRQTEIKTLLETYTCLLKAFNIYKETLQMTVLFHTLFTFIYALINTQGIIEGRAGYMHYQISGTLASVYLIILFSTFARNIIFQTLLGVESEQFYTLNENVLSYCTILTKYLPLDCKKISKNFSRVSRAEFSKLRVCGIYTFDGCLPLNLLTQIATYTIVLLQFALVKNGNI